MKRFLLLAFATVAGAQNAASTEATRAQKAELIQVQRLRDSLVAARWEARRQAQGERDDWQDDFDRVRDSLEAVRQDRAEAENEARRVLRDEAAAAAVVPKVDASDPLDGLRRQLIERVRVLRERAGALPEPARSPAVQATDSALARVASIGGAEQAVAPAVAAWLAAWERSRTGIRLDTTLPRPEGEPLRGTLWSAGGFAGWYRSADGSATGVLLRSPTPGQDWTWREDLPDSVAGALRETGPWSLVPVDPGLGPLGGPGFFLADSTAPGLAQRLASIFSFRDGPLHLLALWAARAVMLLLFGLGVAVVWIGVTRHRAIRPHERDEGVLEPKVLAMLADPVTATAELGRLPETISVRALRAGLAARDLPPEAFEQMLVAFESAETRRLEKGLGLLGTIGSNAPFVGLFGTVCGILDAFAALGREGGGAQAVMTAIAEALIATAIGLAVAIPAIWLYNSLGQRVQEIAARVKDLRTLMVAGSLAASVRGGADREP